ncbi:MAG: type II secretion system protein [Gammaproteobacteria bacterium TMED112]|nr:MAG: type II secretion system protein [Gammaproteobacteria bacterium TMED112]
MANLVEKGKMQILVIGLTRGFTILEILIVLAIISISGTSFYLILNQPKNFDRYEQTINEFKILSIYSGNSYAFTKDSIKILNQETWEELEVVDFSNIYSVTNNFNKTTIIEEDDIFLVISPGNEISIKSLTLSGGQNIEL